MTNSTLKGIERRLKMNCFDGKNFSVSVIIFILIALFIFGSRDIIGLSAGPTSEDMQVQ